MTSNTPTAQEAVKPSCLSVALDYIAAGIDCTPIVGPKSTKRGAGKAPKLEEWQKMHLTLDGFEASFSQGDNVGVITGKHSGLICVDCDKKNGGMEWYEAHKDSLGQCIRETTPGGGVHLFYRYPHGRDFVASSTSLWPGVDFLADGGRQVVTWPSVAKNGKQYVIDNGLNLIDVAYETDAPPDWILQAADENQQRRDEKEKRAQEVIVPITARLDSSTEITIVTELLKAQKPAVQGSYGDQSTYMTALIGRDHLLSPHTTFKLMLEHYNHRCVPPWKDNELWQKVKSAYKSAKYPAGSESVDVVFADDIPQETLTAIDQVEEERKLKGKYVLAKPIQCARRYIKKYPNQVLCDQNQINTYNEQKHCWEMVDDDLFESILLRDINEESATLAEKAKIDQLRTFRIGVKRELEGLFRHIKPDTWLSGTKGEFVSCSNGILDIAKGTLQPHSSTWFSFTTLPFAYDPSASCPVFQSFLDSVWDDDNDLKRALQLWMGYILISPMNDQKFAILIGESRGGKSTLARVMEAMVGKSNTIGCDMMQFGDVFGLEPVIGKKLAVFSDVEKSSGKEIIIATERIKRITGKDPITVNRKNKGMVDTFFATKIVLICNTIPPFINSNSSLTNRMIAFPFTKTFQGREDRDLDAKLEAELPGIFNWALEGARALLSGERLLQSEAGARKVDEIAEVLDNVRGFISDAVKFSEELTAFVPCKTIFETYNRWCKESNYMAHGKKRFFQELSGKADNKIYAGRKREGLNIVRGYFGLKLDEEFLAGHEFSAIENEKNDEDDLIPF